MRRVVEQRPLFLGRQVAGDGLEAPIHLVEAGMQSSHGKVAGEHGTVGTETIDAMPHDRPQAVESPVMIVCNQIRNLDGDIGLAGEKPQAVSPCRHAGLVPVDGTAAVIENELLVGEIRRKPRRIRQLPGEYHQVEAHAVALEAGEACPPSGFEHDAVAGGEAAGRVGVPAQDVADADHPFETRLLIEQGLGARVAQVHMRHVACRHAAGLVERFEPSGLADAVIRLPARLDMDCLDDIVIAPIAAIISRQVVSPDRIESSESTTPRGHGAQPGMAVKFQIPQVMMGVDNRSVVELRHDPETNTTCS